jgi:glycosyltransferase involved in cell wall biosynthesis
LAVVQEDADYFSKLSGKKSLIFNYIPEIIDLPEKVFSKKLLYIASANKINIGTINHFIEKTFPLILKIHPETKLIVGGSICQELKKDHNIELKGNCDDLKSFYESGDIVINPELSGTGYKVKTLEALTYGMPIVATTAGAFGVTSKNNNHLFIADSPQEFAEIIDRLFCNPELIKTTGANAHKWIKMLKRRNLNDLTSYVSNDLTKIRGSV